MYYTEEEIKRYLKLYEHVPDEPAFNLANVTKLSSDILELRKAIKKHRAQKLDDRCWMDDQELYKVLNDGDLGNNDVPPKEEMLKNCARYIDNRCKPGEKWKTYQELEKRIKELEEQIFSLERKLRYD